MDIIFHNDHRLQIREHLFIEIFFHIGTVKRFHFICLVQHNTVSLKFRQYHVVEYRIIFFLLGCHFTVDLNYGPHGLLNRFVPLDIFQQRTVVTRHTNLVELLQIGRINREELDSLIDG